MSILLATTMAAALSTAAPDQPTGNLQLDFDAATQAVNSGACEKALALFASLERDPNVKPGSLPAGAIALRKGLCLFKMGRFDEGETAVLAGLPIIEKAGKSFEVEVADSYRLLGLAAFSRWEYADARAKYERALILQEGMDRLSTLSRLVATTMFEDAPAALAYADEGLRRGNRAESG